MSYGSKPNEIRHPQAALLAEEYVCQRIQSLGYTADLNSEEVNQLTDPNVVEVVDSDPTVSLTIDTNEFGSINLLNQLAGFYPYPVNLGYAIAEDGFSGASVDNTNNQDGTIFHTDFGEVATDFLVAIKDSEAATAQSRALWFSNCFIDSISGSYQVDGFATESISMSGNSQIWFTNGYAASRVERGQFNTTSLIDTSHAGSGASGIVSKLTEDGLTLATSNWTYNAGTGNIDSAGGYAFKSGSRYRYIWLPVTNTFPSLGDSASPVGGVKEGEIELIMWDSNLDSEPGYGTDGANEHKKLRVQSIDYEVSFDREDLKQLYTGTYYKGLNSITVTATVTALDSNLEFWALSTGQYDDYKAGSAIQFSLSDFQTMDKLQARIDIFNTKDYTLHKQARGLSTDTLLKSIRLVDGKVTSVGDSRDVPGRGTTTFDITFTSMYYQGMGLVGR